MNVLETFEELVHKELLVLTGYLVVEADYIMQISVHVVSHDVELPEGSHVTRQYQIMHLDNLQNF